MAASQSGAIILKKMFVLGMWQVYTRYLAGGLTVLFEYNPAKSEKNLEKHGIDFEQAERIWEGWTASFRVEARGEVRFQVIGRIDGEYWTAIYTMRGIVIRIISARRATLNERSEYDRAYNNQR